MDGFFDRAVKLAMPLKYKRWLCGMPLVFLEISALRLRSLEINGPSSGGNAVGKPSPVGRYIYSGHVPLRNDRITSVNSRVRVPVPASAKHRGATPDFHSD